MNGVMMKKQTLVISLLLCQSFVASANQQEPPTSSYNGLNVSGVYSYNNFKFDSTNGNGFNRYKGHMNFYSVGGNNVKLNDYFSAGIFVYWIDTNFHSQFLLPSFSFTKTNQSITNNSLYGHVLGRVNSSFFIDVAGGYGRNTGRSETTVAFPTTAVLSANAHTSGNTWFVSAAGLYAKQWNKFILNANVGVLHTEVKQNPYNFNFYGLNASQFVERLRVNATFILENAELGYQVTPMIQPFVNAGLLQVANFGNSRNISPVGFIGPVPALDLDMNGYKAGGGVSLSYKQYNLRVEQQYFQRGGSYSSNQTTVTLRASFA